MRYEGRLRTIEAVREAGLETCVGGILNLGETREQRVEMAFELAEIDPTSVPINLLNPRPGTKFGDREYMDPWEAVKWIAIFRLILPEALFRLCGGRVENLGELQPLAVKAGLNGVMMGNFLTTLGSDPRGGPGDVRGARAQRRAPGRQRGKTHGLTTVGLAGRRDADVVEELLGERSGPDPQRSFEIRALGSLDPAALQGPSGRPRPRPRRGGMRAAIRKRCRWAYSAQADHERHRRAGWRSWSGSVSRAACG